MDKFNLLISIYIWQKLVTFVFIVAKRAYNVLFVIYFWYSFPKNLDHTSYRSQCIKHNRVHVI